MSEIEDLKAQVKKITAERDHWIARAVEFTESRHAWIDKLTMLQGADPELFEILSRRAQKKAEAAVKAAEAVKAEEARKIDEESDIA